MLAVISSRYQHGPYLFFVAEVMSNYLTSDGLKNISPLPEAPLRPEARGICHICHMVDQTLCVCVCVRARCVFNVRRTAMMCSPGCRSVGFGWPLAKHIRVRPTSSNNTPAAHDDANVHSSACTTVRAIYTTYSLTPQCQR